MKCSGLNVDLIFVMLLIMYLFGFGLTMLFAASTNMDGTVFAPALEQLEHVKSEQGEILTKPFLDACKHILPVIGACSWSLCYWHRTMIKEANDVIWTFSECFILLYNTQHVK